MELGASGTCSSMLELSEDRSSITKKQSNSGNTEFGSSTMPKRKHFYTNAAPVKNVEGNFFRYDFEDKVGQFYSYIFFPHSNHKMNAIEMDQLTKIKSFYRCLATGTDCSSKFKAEIVGESTMY